MPPRFYLAEELIAGQHITLSLDASHHAKRVLRLAQDDAITLFNGKGGEFSAHIVDQSKHSTIAEVKNFLDINRESPLNIELAQAVCTNEKMDWIIQKAVELGVTLIQPITTERSLVRLSPTRAAKRLSHWQKIIISACEQCGRNHIPQLQSILPLYEWLDQKKTNNHANKNTCFILSPSAKSRLKSFPEPTADTQLTLVVGPEGGFTQEEEACTTRTEFEPLQLGQRILRTESAALVAIAAMQTLWGDY